MFDDDLSDIRDGGLLGYGSELHSEVWWRVFGSLMTMAEVTEQVRKEEYAHAARTFGTNIATDVLSQNRTAARVLGFQAYASLAALPIDWSLNSFVSLVDKNGFDNQLEAYRIARKDFGISHRQLVTGADVQGPGGTAYFGSAKWFYGLDGSSGFRRIPSLAGAPLSVERDAAFELFRIIYEIEQDPFAFRNAQREAVLVFQAELESRATEIEAQRGAADQAESEAIAPSNPVEAPGQGTIDETGSPQLNIGAAGTSEEEYIAAANELFVNAVRLYRNALVAPTDERAERFLQVRQTFDQVTVGYPRSTVASRINAQDIPGVDFTSLPPVGWNQAKWALARDLIAAYEGDLEVMNRVADAAPFALMASAAYGDDRVLQKLAEIGWVQVPLQPESTLLPFVGDATASLFENGGLSVLAFRGSATRGDWVTNTLGSVSPTPLLSEQIVDAVKIARAVLRKRPNLILTGHSLGGRLAQAARMALGRPAYVFNSAPVGARELAQFGLANLFLNHDVPLERFRSPQDQLSGVFPANDMEVKNIVETRMIELLNLSTTAEYLHNMSVLFGAMDEVRMARDLGWLAAHTENVDFRPNGSDTGGGTSTPQSQPQQVEQGNEPANSSAGEWGPGIVVDKNVVLGHRPCESRQDVRTCLSEKGLSDEAIAFALDPAHGELRGEVFATQFRELGHVDLAVTQFIGAAKRILPALLNGKIGLKVIEGVTSEQLKIRNADATSLTFLGENPGIFSIYPSIPGHRLLPSGGQRYVVAHPLAQCRACEVLGVAIVFIDFDDKGQMQRQIDVGIADRESFDPASTAVPAQVHLSSQPKLLQYRLNLLGYYAGEMDGYPGPQTRTALMEAQADFCLSPTGQPNSATVDALARASGYSAPCAGARLPEDLDANTPLLNGIYVDDPALCSATSAPYETVHLQQRIVRGRSITWGHEGGCEIRRTDIHDGVTLFRGICSEGNQSSESRWRFDVQSNESFIDLDMPTAIPRDAAPRRFTKCPDESTLRSAFATWFEDAAPRGAGVEVSGQQTVTGTAADDASSEAISTMEPVTFARTMTLNWGGTPQGIVGTLQVAGRLDESGLRLTVQSVNGRHNPSARANPVDRGAAIDFFVNAVPREDCEGCKPTDGSFRSATTIRLRNDVLSGPFGETTAFVPMSVLQRNDLVSVGLVGTDNRIYLSDLTIDLARDFASGRISAASAKANGGFTAPLDTSWVQLASRKSLSEAREFAYTMGEGARIFRTENGWHAITGAILSGPEFDGLTGIVQANGWPADSLLTRGTGFVEELSLREGQPPPPPAFTYAKTQRPTELLSRYWRDSSAVYESIEKLPTGSEVVVWGQADQLGDCLVSNHEGIFVKCIDLGTSVAAEATNAELQGAHANSTVQAATTSGAVSPVESVDTPDFREIIASLDYVGAADKAATAELLQTAFTLIGGMEPDGTAALLGISAKDFASEFVLDPEAMLAVVGSDIVVSAGEAAFAEAAGDLVAGYMFASGPLSQLPNEWQVPLRAFVDATIVESVGLLATGTDPTGASLVGPIVDRLHDVYEIYQATNALSRTQASGLFAVANGAEIAAELVRKHPGEKSEALKADWFAMTRENLRDIVGADDASASYNVTVLGYRALDALGRGDTESAQAEIERMRAVGDATQGLTPLSAEGPIDLLVRLASGGNDAPKVLVETFLKSTSLRSLHPASGSAATAETAGTPEAHGDSASANVDSAQVSPLGVDDFDGVWVQSGQGWTWSFRFEGLTAKIISGGDSARPINSEILRIERLQGTDFSGSWRFRNGRWYDILGSIEGNTIRIRTGRTTTGIDEWTWRRELSSENDNNGVQTTSSSTIRSANAWARLPGIEKVLRDVVANYPGTSLGGCAQAHGPISPELRMRLFDDANMTVVDQRGRTAVRPVTRQMIEGDRFCLNPNNAQCAASSYQLYYCASGEMLFVNPGGAFSGTFRVTDVVERPRNPIVSGAITGEIYGRNLPDIRSERTGCALSNGWSEATGFRWNGACQNGRASGPGTIEWMRGPEVIWRTRVGPNWGIALSDGVLRYDIDLNAFDFSLSSCDQGISGFRSVNIEAPVGTPQTYFENSWVADELMRRGALYAQAECPVDRKGFSNIVVAIELNGEQVVRGRNYEKENLTWREFSNPAARAMQNELQQAERNRVASERQRLAQARADALTAEFQRRRDGIVARAQNFVETGRGNIDDLAAALEIDHLGTLDRLERGATLRLGPVEELATVTHDGERHYRVNHVTSSPFARLEREFRSKQDFSWENWMALTQSAMPDRTELSCLFNRISAVPQETREVRVQLLSFSRGSNSTVISFLCE
ncbi:peptidoglycan-binding protein [Ruegeria pomeroyi]|nr:peptidoglycan-binding protein [Ruegeria pomeroyi]